MPKSQEFLDSSDSDEVKKPVKDDSASDEETEKTTTNKKPKTKTSDSKNDPPAKRAKKSNEADDGAVASSTGSNGERLYELGKQRYVSVSEFKGKPLINIREYYDDKGVQKPGRKGISLSVDQWEKFKTLINQIDKDLKKAN